MAGNRITRKDLIEDKVLRIGTDYAKNLKLAIAANKKWLGTFPPIKKAALDYAKIQEAIKRVENKTEFFKIKQKEEIVRINAVNVIKQEQVALVSVQKVKQSLIDTQKKELSLATQKIRVQKKVIKLTEKERLELRILNRGVKEAAILSSKLSTAYEKQSSKLIRLRRRYKDAALTQGESSKAALRLKKRIDKLDRSLKRVDANVGQFQRSVGNYGKAMRGAAGAARSMASAMGLLGGAFLVVSVIRDAFKRVREFDKSMQNLAGILGVNRKELKGLEKEIIAVASVSVKTSNEVASLAETLIVLGKTKAEVIGLLKPVNNLSIGLQATSQEAGELLIQTLNAFGKSTESAQEYADIIAKMRTSTALDFERIKDALGFLAPTARAAGVSFEKTGAILGVLVDNGIKAARAGRLISSSFLRLAKNGKTLEDALDEINAAQARGVKETELLAIAADLFGLRSAALGLVLADNRDKVAELTKEFENAKGTLDTLTNEQLKSLDARLKILNSTWEKFILNIEKGDGVISGFFKGLIDGIADAISAIDNLNTLSDSFSGFFSNVGALFLVGGGDILKLKVIIKGFQEEQISLQKELIELTTKGHEDEFRSIQEIIEIESLGITQLKERIKLINEKNDRVKTIENILALEKNVLTQEQLQKKSLEELNTLYKSLTKSILKKLDLDETTLEVLKGTVKAYKNLISELENERDAVATSSNEYAEYNKQIDDAKEKIERLTKALKAVNELQTNTNPFGIDKDNILDSTKLLQDKNAAEILAEKQKEEAIQALREGTLEHAIDLNDEQLSILQEAIDLQLSLHEQFEDAKKDLVFAGIESIFDARVQDVEEDILRNREHFAALLDNENLSTEQRDALEAQRDAKNIELEKKKQKREKTAFLVNQGLAIADIAIKLAQTIVAINLAAATIDAITFGIGGTAYRAINLPIAIGTAALQAGIILAQTIPKFEKGTKNHKGGLAEVAEVRPEVITEPNKAPYIVSKRSVLNLPKGTEVTRSVEDYERLMNASILTSVTIDNKRLNDFQAKHVFDIHNKELLNEMRLTRLAISKIKTRFSVYNNIGEDLAFQLKLNDT